MLDDIGRFLRIIAKETWLRAAGPTVAVLGLLVAVYWDDVKLILPAQMQSRLTLSVVEWALPIVLCLAASFIMWRDAEHARNTLAQELRALKEARPMALMRMSRHRGFLVCDVENSGHQAEFIVSVRVDGFPATFYGESAMWENHNQANAVISHGGTRRLLVALLGGDGEDWTVFALDNNHLRHNNMADTKNLLGHETEFTVLLDLVATPPMLEHVEQVIKFKGARVIDPVVRQNSARP